MDMCGVSLASSRVDVLFEMQKATQFTLGRFFTLSV